MAATPAYTERVVLRRDRALLLKRYPYSESSLIAHLGTREHGRVHVIAKGAYRTTSRYFAILDFFDTLEIEWDHSPRRELSNLRAGSVVVRRRSLAGDLERYRAGLSMLELADQAFRAEQPEPALYALLENSLDALEEGRQSADATIVVFELLFLNDLGLAPALESCAACAGPALPVGSDGARVAFSAGAGGRLCRACAEEARASGRRVGTLPLQVMNDAALILLAAAAQRSTTSDHPLLRDAAARLEQDRLDCVRDFVERFLGYHLESRPRTHRAFLSVGNRNSPPAPETA